MGDDGGECSIPDYTDDEQVCSIGPATKQDMVGADLVVVYENQSRGNDRVGEHLDVSARTLSARGAGGGEGQAGFDIVLDLWRGFEVSIIRTASSGGSASCIHEDRFKGCRKDWYYLCDCGAAKEKDG